MEYLKENPALEQEHNNVIDQIVDSIYNDPDSWTFKWNYIFNNELGIKIEYSASESYPNSFDRISNKFGLVIPINFIDKFRIKRARRWWSKLPANYLKIVSETA